MVTILFRLGVVSWWFGTIWAVGWSVGLIVGLLSPDRSGIMPLSLMMAVAGIVPAWALSYILTGSFRKPPKQH